MKQKLKHSKVHLVVVLERFCADCDQSIKFPLVDLGWISSEEKDQKIYEAQEFLFVLPITCSVCTKEDFPTDVNFYDMFTNQVVLGYKAK